MPSSDAYLVVLTTLPNLAQSRKLSRLLLKSRLAACTNIFGPAESSFWWKGKIDKSREYLMLVKTRASHFKRLRELIGKNHPYSVPEIIALRIQAGNAAYLDWLKTSTVIARQRSKWLCRGDPSGRPYEKIASPRRPRGAGRPIRRRRTLDRPAALLGTLPRNALNGEKLVLVISLSY